jgi:hypothetical protein
MGDHINGYGLPSIVRALRRRTARSWGILIHPLPFLEQRLEFSQSLAVLAAPGRALERDQRRQRYDPAPQAFEFDDVDRLLQRLVPAAAVVVSVKFSPRKTVSVSSVKGSPGGAPRRYGRKGWGADTPARTPGGRGSWPAPRGTKRLERTHEDDEPFDALLGRYSVTGSGASGRAARTRMRPVYRRCRWRRRLSRAAHCVSLLT